MAPIPRRDYSIPRPTGFRLGTDGQRVPFPAVRRAALVIHNVVRRFFPTKDSYPVDTAAQPTLRTPPGATQGQRVPYVNPNWPKDHTAVIREPGK